MKLCDCEYNIELEINENSHLLLVIENPLVFRHFMKAIWEECEGAEGPIVLSEGSSALKISQIVGVIYNPFSFDPNQRKLLSAVYQDLAKSAQNIPEKLACIHGRIVELLEEISLGEEYFIDYTLDFPINEIFKAYSVRISMEDDSLVERILRYTELRRRFLGTKVLVIVDPGVYLSPEELLEFYQKLKYKEIAVITISSKQYTEDYDYDSITIIDKDKCFIYC